MTLILYSGWITYFLKFRLYGIEKKITNRDLVKLIITRVTYPGRICILDN